ncbi:MAG: energy transducer TonB [bacterium]|nr:energy transducer TonB [bacterium]
MAFLTAATVLVTMAVAVTAADPIDTADAPLTTPRILWLESGAGSCGPVFDAPAVPIELVPVPYPENARLSNLEIPIRVRGVIGASGAVTLARARRQTPFLAEPAEQALLASTFRPAMMGGVAVASAIEVVYDFRLRPGAPRSDETMPGDEELERCAGRELPEAVRAFLQAADSFAIFRMSPKWDALDPGERTPCPTRDLDLRTCGGRYSFPHAITAPVALSADEAARVKDLLLVQSPTWAPQKGDDDLKFAGMMVQRDFGISARRGDDEMFILFNLSRMGRVEFRNAQECYGGGHPYRRTTELFCALLEARLGWGCLEDEW